MTFPSIVRRLALLTTLVLSSVSVFIVGQAQSMASIAKQQLIALENLRDSGLISEDEYQQKVAAIQAAHGVPKSPSQTHAEQLSALRQLRDTGVLSAAEYDQKVSTLSGVVAFPAPALVRRSVVVPTSAPPVALPVPPPPSPTVDHLLPDLDWGLPWGTIKLPLGWGFNGGVLHAEGKNCTVSGDSPMWAAESPDKLYGVAILPLLKTNWTSDLALMRVFQQNRCPIVASDKAVDYLTRFVLPRFHKDFRILWSGPEPQFAQAAQQMREQIVEWGRIGENGSSVETQRSVDTARVVLEYREEDHLVNEIASAIITCTDTRMHPPASPHGESDLTRTVECTNAVTVILHRPDNGMPISDEAIEAQQASVQTAFFQITPNQGWGKRSNLASQQKFRQLMAEAKPPSLPRDFKSRLAIQDTGGHARSSTGSASKSRVEMVSQVSSFYTPASDYNVYSAPSQRQVLTNQYSNSYMNADGTVSLQASPAPSTIVDWQLMTPKY